MYRSSRRASRTRQDEQAGHIPGDAHGDGDLEVAVVSMTSGDPSVTSVKPYDVGGSYATPHRDWVTYHRANTRGGLYRPATMGARDGEIAAYESQGGRHDR